MSNNELQTAVLWLYRAVGQMARESNTHMRERDYINSALDGACEALERGGVETKTNAKGIEKWATQIQNQG